MKLICSSPRRPRAFALFALLPLSALYSQSIYAQKSNESSLPTVVVTATRSEQDPFNIPAAIDSVPIDDTRSDGLNVNLSAVLGLVPGVLARNRQNYAQDEQISIRGFGARSTFGVRGVRLYTDGIPATMPDGSGQVTHFNLNSADRIEVLRGPFSSLYGNSSGGVIQIFTAVPREPFELRGSLVGGTDDTVRGSLNLRGRGERVGYNIDLTEFQTNGYRDHSAAERRSGNAKLDWQINNNGTLSLLANAVSIPNAKDPLGLTWSQFKENPRSVAAVAKQYNTRKSVDQSQAGVIWEQALRGNSALRVLAYAGQREVEQFLAIPIAAQNAPRHAGGVIALDGSYSGGDARWTWSTASFEWTIGATYESQNQQRRGYENFIGTDIGVRGALRRNEDNRVNNFDQYAQATWQFAEAWSLMTGVRHSTIRFRADDHYITSNNPDDGGARDYSATNPVAGLIYKASPTTNLYATWGKGFETPTFAELGYRSDGAAGLNFDLLPARSDNAELGAKFRLDDKLESNIALFRATTDDEIAIATNSGGRTTYRNIGSARRQGFEASLLARFGDDWTVQVAGTWLDAEFRSPFLACTGTPCTTPTTSVDAGTRIPGVPRSHVQAALNWGDELGWRASTRIARVGAVTVNDIGSESAPSYTTLGFDLGYGFALQSGTLRSFMTIDNLLDRNYVGSVIVNDGNARFYETGQGRSVMLGLQWLWAKR